MSSEKEPSLTTLETDVTNAPSVSTWAVLGESDEMPPGQPECRGFDFNRILKNVGFSQKSGTQSGKNEKESQGTKTESLSTDLLDAMMESFLTTGFQATNIGLAIEEINRMRSWRLSDVPFKEGMDDELRDPQVRSKIRSKIFLGYTSNQISSGQRETIRFLVQHSMVDVIVTTAGGIEEDVIKCLRPTYIGDFNGQPGPELRVKGINRIGNLLVPNNNYCKFEDWFGPLLNKMHDEQDKTGIFWTPSTIIERMGLEINNEESVLYWAAKNKIPVFCPALTDGSIGDMIYFHSYKRSGFVLDIVGDIRKINDCAVRSHSTGMILLGGGLIKHHTCNANLMRNGADFSVFINTGQEFDGSDSGARPDEAISWGKIKITAKPVKVYSDATISFPLIVSQTFAKNVEEWKKSVEDCICWIEN
uniref:deoxyhypusine synthase n=1 Tax=Corethron hystrix TaxID=216773 RepID=A0A7S1BPC0_9STRA|mmetsp:Transcript_34828/g.80509  ORF Transcript_34828/g.80509 Transcript_34828/m.80509 type:complete len:419 (+) Transcript_34828:250-1506(+)